MSPFPLVLGILGRRYLFSHAFFAGRGIALNSCRYVHVQHDELVNLPSRTAPFPKRKRALWSRDIGDPHLRHSGSLKEGNVSVHA